ncbi:hypothetical protein HNR23_003429 [Nocardiopsis mwathae]|uniref:Uncharacterized protein n=1 Tax=Nocardiopsis mwathae TaxID=1472723 RepID=A0A7W9YJV7_9ACTN|nr:hypothetical protein [Nocardiopsis mwathae]MBB6173369.1 hypothetical protein [Nocardiopsis mwathae]
MKSNRLQARSANRVRPYIAVLEHQRAAEALRFQRFAVQVALSAAGVGR